MKPLPIYFVFSLTFLNGSSLSASRVVLALYALELGAQPFAVGMLAATFSAFPMLLAVPAGRFADRFGARWMLMFGSTAGALGMLLAYSVSGLAVMFAAAAMMGLGTVIYNVSLQNLVGLLSESHDRAKNFSNYSLIKSISDFVGPLIAGFSIDYSGHTAACLYLALLTFAPVALLAVRGGAMRGGVQHVKRAGGGVRSMLAVPGVRRLLATSSLLNTGQDLYQFYMPVYTHAIGLSASAIGIVLAMNSTAAFVVRLVLPRLIARFKEDKILAYAFFAGAVSLMLIPFFKAAVVLALISFIFGLGMGCGGPIVTMLMFTSSADGRSGEALGLKITVNHFTKLVSPVVFGSIASVFGMFPMFWINALMLGAGGMLSRADAGRAS